MTQVTNNDGLYIIKKFEGCKLDSYKLPGEKHFTIGYGHSFDDSIKENTVWTQAQADAALKKDLKKFEDHVTSYAKQYGFKFNENQFSALVSYCYNRGPGGLKELLSHSKTVADMAKNIVIYWGSAERYKAGLVRRRKAEQALFLKPVAHKSAPKPEVHKPAEKHAKTISQLADEVMRGMHGTGRERMIALGTDYAKVQEEVTRRIRNSK